MVPEEVWNTIPKNATFTHALGDGAIFCSRKLLPRRRQYSSRCRRFSRKVTQVCRNPLRNIITLYLRRSSSCILKSSSVSEETVEGTKPLAPYLSLRLPIPLIAMSLVVSGMRGAFPIYCSSQKRWKTSHGVNRTVGDSNCQKVLDESHASLV